MGFPRVAVLGQDPIPVRTPKNLPFWGVFGVLVVILVFLKVHPHSLNPFVAFMGFMALMGFMRLRALVS